MSFYIGREASKLWKRICAEITTEINLLLAYWKCLLVGLVFQYIHGLAARGVHYLHRPGPTLQDLGFILLPELGQDKAYISETLFSFIFVSFVLWTFHPFILKSGKIYTVLIWCRVLAFLVLSQVLRIITFYSTQLPGPNYHCREGSKLATLPRPESVLEVLLINFPHGVLYGCGDLIFSSHMIFTLVFVRTYQKYGTRRRIKQLGWLLAVSQSLLIVASRKHYTVDIVVAWYTVNLVVFFIEKKLPEYLSPYCKVLCLSRNMMLTRASDGSDIEDTEMSDDAFDELINSVYPDVVSNLTNTNYFKERFILAPTLKFVTNVNNYIMSKLPGEEKIYLSSDSVCVEEGNMESELEAFSPEILPHKLILKEGVPITLLRNIDQSNGLCNGTRLQIKRMRNHVIECLTLTGNRVGQVVSIPRINMVPNNETVPVKFQRRQFPVKVSFAMTIHESQGQTLSTVGLYSPRPVFTQG